MTAGNSAASTSTLGDMTTAGTIKGIGSFATPGSITIPTTKNTVALSADSKTITVTFGNQTSGYLQTGSAESQVAGDFTVASGSSVILDAASNQVNTYSAPTEIYTTDWDYTRPTITDAKLYDSYLNDSLTAGGTFALGQDGRADTLVLTSSETLGTITDGATTRDDWSLTSTSGEYGNSCSGGTVNYSVITNQMSPPNVPTKALLSAPTNIAAVMKEDGTVKLSWTDPAVTDLKQVAIYRAKNGQIMLGTIYATVLKGIGYYIDSDIKTGEKIEYALKATDLDNYTSKLSESIFIDIKDIISPEVINIEATDNRELTVTFTEAIDPNAVKETFLITDENGKKLEIAAISVSNDKVILKTNSQKIGTTYTLKVPNFENLATVVSDLSGNAMKDVYIGTFKGIPSPEFTDVTMEGQGWALDAINWARTSGYVSGRKKGVFAPGSKVARSEFAAMLAKVMSSKEGNDLAPDGKSPFNDVTKDSWYSLYVNYLYNEGITKGRQPGLFVPGGYAFKVEIAAMLIRWIEGLNKFKPEITNITENVGLGLWENPYADVKNDAWYTRTMAIAAYYKIILGREIDGKSYASPVEKVTRAETVVMLKKAFDLINN